MNIPEQTIRAAISKWGTTRQLQMVREECLELALAIGKFLERNENLDPALAVAMQKEIADVNIMIAQANIMCDEKKIQEFIDQKVQRLEGRLERSEF